MRRMNFEQAAAPRHPRDIGGPSGAVLMVLAIVLVAVMFALAMPGQF